MLDPARVGPADAAALDGLFAGLLGEPDPRRVTRVAAAALALDRVAECRAPLRRILDAGRRGRAVPAALAAAGLLCAADVATGRWDEADDLATEGVTLAAQHGDLSAAGPLRLAAARMAAAGGDDVRARALVDQAGTPVAEGRCVLALAALGRGADERAYRHALAVTPVGRLEVGTAPLRVSLDLVEAAVRLDRREDAERHVRAMRAAPVRAVSPRFAMLCAAAAGLVAEPAAATTWFEEALACPDADRWPFDQARVQLVYGEHLRRERCATSSRVLLGAALDTFERLGARPWAARARHGLRATGVTVGRATGRPVALTPEERTVAALAAAGLTNKQIARRLMVSHHTVAARLYQVFPKLGVGSRAALAHALANLDDGALASDAS